MATTGMTQPVVRRVTSSTSATSRQPTAMSMGSGNICRSSRSSPPAIKYQIT